MNDHTGGVVAANLTVEYIRLYIVRFSADIYFTWIFFIALLFGLRIIMMVYSGFVVDARDACNDLSDSCHIC